MALRKSLGVILSPAFFLVRWNLSCSCYFGTMGRACVFHFYTIIYYMCFSADLFCVSCKVMTAGRDGVGDIPWMNSALHLRLCSLSFLPDRRMEFSTNALSHSGFPERNLLIEMSSRLSATRGTTMSTTYLNFCPLISQLVKLETWQIRPLHTLLSTLWIRCIA
jgi:hypothetical protein